MNFIPLTIYKNRIGLIGLILQSLIIFPWFCSVSAASQPTPQLVNSKLKMATQITASIDKEIAKQPIINEQLKEINLKIENVHGLIQQNKWKEADEMTSVVIRELITLRSQSKKPKPPSCLDQITKLKRTASLLINIFETTEKPSETDINAEKVLNDQLKALDMDQNDQNEVCNQLQQSIENGIATIEGHYENNTAVVELDLTTAQKRYEYDIKRYNTYNLLLQKKMDMSNLRDQARARIAILIKEASVLSHEALDMYNNTDFEQAEILQAKSNTKLVMALRVTGLYLSE